LVGLTRASEPDTAADLIALVAHEVAQPLTSAIGCAFTLRNSSQELDDGDKRIALDILIRNLEQLRLLIGGLGIFGRIGSDDFEIQASVTSLSELCGYAEEDFAKSYPTKTLDVDSTDGQITIDAVMMKQVLFNLLANAHKYSPAGSTVRLVTRENADGHVIKVSNEGEGFDQGDAERIFDRSIQLDPGAPGVGIGLFVARAIVEAHGGTVSATSVPGEGATFTVFIPHQVPRRRVSPDRRRSRTRRGAERPLP
jgi:signal transduction histidine kinase